MEIMRYINQQKDKKNRKNPCGLKISSYLCSVKFGTRTPILTNRHSVFLKKRYIRKVGTGASAERQFQRSGRNNEPLRISPWRLCCFVSKHWKVTDVILLGQQGNPQEGSRHDSGSVRDVTSVRCEVAVMPLTEEPTITCSRMCERARYTESWHIRIQNRIRVRKRDSMSVGLFPFYK